VVMLLVGISKLGFFVLDEFRVLCILLILVVSIGSLCVSVLVMIIF